MSELTDRIRGHCGNVDLALMEGEAATVASVSATASTSTFAATGVGIGLAIGDEFFTFGFANAKNNGFHRVKSRTDDTVVVWSTLVDAAASGSVQLVANAAALQRIRGRLGESDALAAMALQTVPA